jgi:hypothetical protein
VSLAQGHLGSHQGKCKNKFVPSRRSVIRTAAWTAPAVTVAAAAPAFAATGAPNLSTSVSGGTPTRDGLDVTIAPSTLNNTGTQETGGVVVAFSSTVAIDNLQLDVFGSLMDPSALGITVTGLGTTSVTMEVPASLANIAPGGSWTSPASQVLTMADETAFDLTVTATAVNGGTPFTPPTVTIPGTPPNLSTSTSGGTPTRDGNVVTIAPSTLNNTGGTETGGVDVEFVSDVVIDNLQVNFMGSILDPVALGITVTGLGTTTVTMAVPASLANIAPGGSWTSPASQVLTFATADPATVTVTATATNGGTPFAAPTFTV